MRVCIYIYAYTHTHIPVYMCVGIHECSCNELHVTKALSTQWQYLEENWKMWRFTDIWFLVLGKSNIWINSLSLLFTQTFTQYRHRLRLNDPMDELISIHFPDAFLASALSGLELRIIKLPNWIWAQGHPVRDYIFYLFMKCRDV